MIYCNNGKEKQHRTNSAGRIIRNVNFHSLCTQKTVCVENKSQHANHPAKNHLVA